MDRLNQSIDEAESLTGTAAQSAIGFGEGDDHLVAQSASHLAIPQELFNLNQLDVLYEASRETLWTYMWPEGRPSFTPPMLADFVNWQRLIGENFGPGHVPLRYLVLASRTPGVFCFGGDLELFQRLIRAKDRVALVQYGYRCVEILHRNINTLDLPILTIGLVQGAALGGGFEALLSFDYIIAERGATFGLPEVMFGLFPGMGAHAILSRKLGTAMAERLIVSNKTYSAEEMYDMGIVHQLAEPGDGLEACKAFIDKSRRRHAGLVNAHRAMKHTRQLPLEELKHIVDLWADTALQLTEHDLKVMSRLTRAQTRLPGVADTL